MIKRHTLVCLCFLALMGCASPTPVDNKLVWDADGCAFFMVRSGDFVIPKRAQDADRAGCADTGADDAR